MEEEETLRRAQKSKRATLQVSQRRRDGQEERNRGSGAFKWHGGIEDMRIAYQRSAVGEINHGGKKKVGKGKFKGGSSAPSKEKEKQRFDP